MTSSRISRFATACFLACSVLVAGGARADVVINEILYHPSNASVQPGEDAEGLQFIELYNSGPAEVNLSGASFAGGVVYTFPGGTTMAVGEYIVVAANTAFMTLRGPAIPTGVKVFQWVSGDLANGGELIRLVDASAGLIDEVTFDDSGLWPSGADGAGSSLELVNPAFDKSYPLAWRASSVTDGTPGAVNSMFSQSPVILIDAPARGSVVAGLTTVSITFAEPVSGVVAGNLVVDGSAATSVTCSSCAAGVGVGPWVFGGFAIPTSNPMTVSLAAGAIVDQQSNHFAGDTWLYFLSVPKIVINELHYNPASSTDDEEFIELFNADYLAVDISGWKISEFGSPGCTFPAATVVPVGGYVVCAKDPVALQTATGYHTDYSWGISDSLSNGGEPVSVLNASGTVVDRVVYTDAPPWPSGTGGPDGFGPSLELTNPNVDNSQGQYWAASVAANGTPGRENGRYTDVPMVASELPTRGSIILEMNQITVTFSKPVTGVTADDLEVNDIAANSVSGSGAGPYVFNVVNPDPGAVSVVLKSGGISDLSGTGFAGDSWLYFFDLPNIVINEIHYNPADSTVAAGEDAQDLQFIELFNNDDFPVDLSGFAFSEGVSFIFPSGAIIPAGGYLVVAANGLFLESMVDIPAGAQVVNWTAGDLANGGEKIVLSDIYGHVIDSVSYNDSGDWTDGADGKGPSLELINPGLANDGGGAWQASISINGTPGAVNSTQVINPAPVIFGTLHSPALPQAYQFVTITTNVVDDTAPLSVVLYYRQDVDPPVAYSSTEMFDDGLHGDGEAGDGRYGVVVAGLDDGQQLDFYIQAGDGTATSVAPAGHSVANRFGYPSQTYLCAFSNEEFPVDFPVYHILVTLNNKHNQEALSTYPERKEAFDCTFIDGDGNIWYNILERFRGQSSLFKYPSSYRIDFPSNRKLDSSLGFPVESLQLNGMRPASQWLGFNLFNRAGMPAPRVGWAHVRYTGINYDTCCTGQNSYYGLHVVVERLDNDFLDSQNGKVVPNRSTSSEGNLYRGRNDGNLRWEGTDPNTYRTDAHGQNGYEKYNNETEDFWGDLIGVCDAVSNTTAENYVAHIKAHVDEDNWARYYALQMLMGNREGGIYLDTGDDYFIYMPPPNDPLNPTHPDVGTTQYPDDRLSGKSQMIPWDTDSVLWGDNFSIWRTNVPAAQTFLRNNAFAPIFVKDIEDLAGSVFSSETMNAIIDSMPDAAFGTGEGSDLWPETKAQYKTWIANRIPYVLNETYDDLTLDNGTSIAWSDPTPSIHLTGRLQQAGTHNITVNGMQATFNVYTATWSYDLALVAGVNAVLVQAWDRAGNEKDRVEATVFYNPPGPMQIHMEVRAPRRMINDKTVTIEARITDPIGRVSWNQWSEFGTVSVVRLPDRTPVATTNTVFDNGSVTPEDSIHFVNGWGSISFTLDDGVSFAPGEIEVTVDWHGLKASRNVTVMASPSFRDMSGTLTGTNLVWGPDENIRVTGNITVAAGSTLTINPGTIIQVNTTGSLENGTLLTINGSLQALGTKDSPVFFFSEKGPQAMTLTQSGSASNGYAWRGFQFYGSAASTMRQVILTGAGNGNVVSHPRPPVLGLFNTHSLFVDRCVLADNNGMIFSGQGTGTYTVRKTLVSRAGIGAEFFGNGHTLRIKDSWFTRIGHAPEANGLDGDLLHVDGSASNQLITSSIVNDGGDDGIDHSASTFTVEHSIITNVRDKSVSMTGGHATVVNTLMFKNGSGIRGTASTDHVTINVGSPIGTVDNVQRSIIWPASISTCSGTVDYTDVGSAADLGCGTGNISVDPQFMDTAHNDYNPKPGSPALTAGPNQDRIGWLGFPYGSTCLTTADCNDTNACTTDVCVDKLCTFTPIVGCMPCDINEDCDDSNDCTVDVCAEDGSCSYTPKADGAVCSDGKSCTSPDTCSGGVCAGPQNCPGGGQCDASGACATVSGTIVFQNGLNDYTGTQDTYMHEASPSVTRGDDVLLRWDSEDPAPIQIVGLLRFDAIFGTGVNQIPDGATITSAILTIFVEDVSVDPPAVINEVLVPWDEATTTWNNFGGEAGVQSDEYGTQVGVGPVVGGACNLDVTTGVAAWLANPASNLGWVFRPMSWDGIRVTSSEGATQANRPKLTVTFNRPINGCRIDADCNDGLFCNGVETCDTVSMRCVQAASAGCDDAVACTTDSCDEATDSCQNVGTDVLCDDGNLCTDDVCNVTAGCQHTNNTVACDDSDACTTNDVCADGVCQPGTALVCDDGVACTADACDPATGCATTDTCSNGLVCNLSNGICEAGPTNVTFRDGEGEYDGTVDTYVDASRPDTSNAISATLMVDGPTPATEERHILLRFDDVFGTGPGQVPPGSRIVSATLTMFVTNSSADGADLYRVLIPWTDSLTWNQAVGGIQQDGLESMAVADVSGATNSNRVPYDMDVTNSLIAWSAGQTNNGWVFVMPVTGTDSWQFAASEEQEIEQRPKLAVSFIPCDPGYTGDGVTCFDFDECQAGASACNANAECTNSEGSYSCECDEGFKGDGVTCNECPGGATMQCTGHGTCDGDVEGAHCTCEDGFRGDACEDCLPGLWGANCDEMCAGGMANPCNDHGECLDGPVGTGACTCDDRYDGPACEQCAIGYTSYPDCTQNPECGDDNECTTDSFDPLSGCVHEFNNTSCDDLNACTTDDHCLNGTCAAGSDVFCNDNDKCTEDSCDTATGCLHEVIEGCCTADNDCDDGDPCTTDVCHTQISICSNVPIDGCGSADGIDDHDVIEDIVTGDEGNDVADTQSGDFIETSDTGAHDPDVTVSHSGCQSDTSGASGSLALFVLLTVMVGMFGVRRARRYGRGA